MHDRIRAKPPVTDVDSWTEATIEAITPNGDTVVVVCDGTEITVSKTIYDMVVSRLPNIVGEDDTVVGQTVWYK